MFYERYELCVNFISLKYFFAHQVFLILMSWLVIYTTGRRLGYLACELFDLRLPSFFDINVMVGYLHYWKKIRLPGV